MVIKNNDRDALLSPLGKKTLEDRYLLPGEEYQDLFVRVASAYADDDAHAQRLYDYMSKLWFMPATPILSNGGTDRGLPISCFLNEVQDSMESIADVQYENFFLAARGGGIGTYWSNLRSIGEGVGRVGRTSGVIPFIKMQDSQTLGVSQGSLRRGSAAVYLNVHHPEIEEFLEIRKPTGDGNRKSLNIHHGVAVTDEFMRAVENDEDYELRSPKDNHVVRTARARKIWEKILRIRLQTGEPYILFVDTANNARPRWSGEVKTSNLCTEIMLHTSKERTAVCCLSSLNFERYDEWKDTQYEFLLDVFKFLDNVLQDFIDRAPESHSRAIYSAMRERSVGLGAMGWHSYLQAHSIAFESDEARNRNIAIWSRIASDGEKINRVLAEQRGACPDANLHGINARFTNMFAVAPTSSISIICGGTSAGIEPIPANCYNNKNLSGTFFVKNRYLEKHLTEIGMNTVEVWESILEKDGSVQHLDFLSDKAKAIFKTAFELNQIIIVQQAADRQPYIDQGQSLNLFFSADIDPTVYNAIHIAAWRKRVKSLYYMRSRSVQRAENPNLRVERKIIEECEACQ